MKSLISLMYNDNLSLNIKDFLIYVSSKHDYEIFCETIVNYILDDYSRAETCYVELICDSGKKQHTIKMNLFQFLINMYFLEFNFVYNVPITKEFLFNVDKGFLANFHDNIEKMAHRIQPIIEEKKIDENSCFSFLFSHLTERTEQLCELFSAIAAPTISLIDVIDFSTRNVEFNRLLNTTLDDTKTFKQLEEQLKFDGNRLYDVILADKKSCLYPFVVADCVNKAQMSQFFVAVGPRMTTTNVVMPHIMTRSYLNGLQNVGDIIAEAEMANKALIYKKKFVGISGYMSHETDLLNLNQHIDFKMKDCGTKHYVNYNVKSSKHLKLIINKNIILPDGKLSVVTANDKKLIGTIVKLRSMTCCAHPSPYFVCKTCYGNPSSRLKHVDIGGLTSTEIENVLSNAVMSVKHHVETDTSEFNNKDLLKYFSDVDNKLFLKRLDNAENISLVFDKEYIEDLIDRMKNDIDIDDSDLEEDVDNPTNINSRMIANLKIVIKKMDPIENVEIEDECEIQLDGCFLTLADDMLNMTVIKNINCPIDSDDAILKLSDLKAATAVFNIKHITKETSRYLKQLKDVIERSKPNWHENNLDTPTNDFADLIISAGLKGSELVHAEPVLRKLTRDKNNILKLPDWKRSNVDFMMVNLKTGIFKGDLYSALSFEEVTKTFKDTDSFKERGEGAHDSQFNSNYGHDFKYMEKALKKANLI